MIKTKTREQLLKEAQKIKDEIDRALGTSTEKENIAPTNQILSRKPILPDVPHGKFEVTKPMVQELVKQRAYVPIPETGVKVPGQEQAIAAWRDPKIKKELRNANAKFKEEMDEADIDSSELDQLLKYLKIPS